MHTSSMKGTAGSAKYFCFYLRISFTPALTLFLTFSKCDESFFVEKASSLESYAGAFSPPKRIDLTGVKDAPTFEIFFELVVQLKLLFRFQVVNLQTRDEKRCQTFFR